MKTFTNEDIRKWGACYNPIRYLKDDEIHTAISILNRDDIPFEDRLWCVLRIELVSEKVMRLFAVWCARQIQHLMKDQRSFDAIDIAERFANGNATTEELALARDAAWDAAEDAARDTFGDAAWIAASVAARDEAWIAARDVACVATRVAGNAARVAVGYAARDVAKVVGSAAIKAQKIKLIEMIEAEGGKDE